MINKEQKKALIENWQNAFPCLTKYDSDRFLKIIGPLIVGIQLIKLPRTDEYRPCLVFYPLFGNKLGSDIKSCLSGPVLIKDFKDARGFQYSISYSQDIEVLNELYKNIIAQLPLPLDRDVKLYEMISAIDNYIITSPLSTMQGSYLLAALYEVKLKIALYVSTDEAQKVVEEVKAKDWNLDQFSSYGIDYNNWIISLQEAIINRAKLLSLIDLNKKQGKIAELKQSQLLPG